MLLGEQFGRRHEGRLIAVLEREQHGEERHDGLAGADVTHQQAVHPFGPRHVVEDLASRLLLVGGEFPGQAFPQLRGERLVHDKLGAALPVACQLACARQHQLQVEQFIDRQPAPAALCLG